MSTDGYELLAHRIRAAYPRAYISDLTIADWTHRLSELEPGPAREVAERLANLSGPPHPVDFRDARRAVLTVYFAALPAPPRVPVAELLAPERDRWEETKARVAPFLREAMERIERGDVPSLPDSSSSSEKGVRR